MILPKSESQNIWAVTLLPCWKGMLSSGTGTAGSTWSSVPAAMQRSNRMPTVFSATTSMRGPQKPATLTRGTGGGRKRRAGACGMGRLRVRGVVTSQRRP